MIRRLNVRLSVRSAASSALCFLPHKIKDLCLINVQTSVSSPVGLGFPCAVIEKGAPEDSGLFIRLTAVD